MIRREFLIAGAAASLAGACSAQPGESQSTVPADAPDGPPTGRPRPSALYNHLDGKVPARPDIGWAVLTLKHGGTAAQNGERGYLMQSVFKLWLAAAWLDRVDAGEAKLEDRIKITKADLGYYHEPIAARVGPNGYDATLLELIRYIVIESDNPAAEVLLTRLGGPGVLTAWLKEKGVNGIRVDRGERALHAAAAEIDNATGAKQNALVDRFVGGTLDGSTLDGATPDGSVDALADLHRGKLLSPASTRLLISIMGETATGEKRVKAGLEPGWTWAHKTGTGGRANGQTRTLGVGDIGLLTSPDGDVYAVAMFVGGAAEPMPVQEGWFAELGRAVIAQWKQDKAKAAR